MIVFEKMRQLHEKGINDVNSLAKDELTIFQGFSAWVTDQIAKYGLSHRASTADIAVNSFKAGFALGLGAKIEDRKVVERY